MKKLGYILFPLFTLGVGALAGYLSESGLTQVYPLLEKSPLTPPGYVFPLVWAVLYLHMGLGLARVVQRGGPGSGLAAFFWLGAAAGPELLLEPAVFRRRGLLYGPALPGASVGLYFYDDPGLPLRQPPGRLDAGALFPLGQLCVVSEPGDLAAESLTAPVIFTKSSFPLGTQPFLVPGCGSI